MKQAVVLVFLASCFTTNLTVRPQWNLLPSCLIVNSTARSWQRDHVAEIAKEWNDRLNYDAIHVAPECRTDDEFVPFSFVEELPDDCSSYYACTYSRLVVDGVPRFREVVVQEDAPITSIYHEISHLVGCRHEDLDPPCL